MVPEKDTVDKSYRDQVLRRVAKVAKSQGNYAVAAKMYTQAGERKKAMKASLGPGCPPTVPRWAPDAPCCAAAGTPAHRR